MKFNILLSAILISTVSFCQSLTSYVQPLAGTAPSTTVAAQKHSDVGSEKNANTIPAVGPPFAMTQWTPQTRQTEVKCQPPYFYTDTILSGFRGTHWLSGSCTQDYGSFTIMPVFGKLKTQASDYSRSFSHNNETATPASYKLAFDDFRTEITATERCGMMRITATHSDSMYLLVLPNSDQEKGFIQIDKKAGVIWGYNPVHRIYQGWGEPAGFSGYFYIKIEKAFGNSGTFSGADIFLQDSLSGKENMGAFVGLKLSANEQLLVKIGTSFSSVKGAIENLQTEIPHWSFEQVLQQANDAWQKALSQVTVSGQNEKDKRIFYTSMYHAMQHPRLFNDVDGTYPKFAGNNELEKISKGNYYDDFSMWDIYRAQLPLHEILRPNTVNDFVQSLVLKGSQGGWMPIFPCWNSYTSAMIGDHTASVIASAYSKGITNYNVEEAYRLLRKNAFEVAGNTDYLNGMGRRALPSYLKFGYIPMEDSVPIAFHKKEQVSRTLEYAYNDYALSVMAKGLNKIGDFALLKKRSLNYKNVYNSSVGMMRGRYEDGTWYEPFKADTREPYITEGTPRQYTFYVPQDVPGLAQLMGGRKSLQKALDSLFYKNEYWHGNEPGHQIPFMYNYTAAPWKTQAEVKKILNEEYSDGPGGLSGNDDAGQMSAWYIFASLGFYPVNPVSGEHLLTTPLFDSISIQLPGNKKFEVVCHKSAANDIYIKKVNWNGQKHQKNYITYKMIMKGGRLDIYLQSTPSTWGSNTSSQPIGLK
jgi:predicted alpha-1,2-mannosidase